MLAFPSRLLSAPPPPSAARSSLFLAATATATATAPRMMSTTNLPNHNSAQPILVNDGNNNNNLAQVLQYHHQTKHSFSNYARGPRGLDWANQPNPFRRYSPAPLLPLLHPDSSSSAAYPAVFLSPRPSPPAPLSLAAISQLFYDSLALSAWKSTGFSTWSLRVNPSSGNLHPTEAYLVSPAIPSLSDSPFVAHYAPKEHSLELRAVASAPVADFFPRFFPAGSFLVGLSSIFWRESWKYGERAFRYCNHDVGHAIAAVAFAAASLGWDVRLLDGLGFKDLERIMGLELQNAQFEIPSKPVKGSFRELEFEHPDCLLLVSPSSSPDFSINYAALSSAIAEYSTSLKWQGKPNSLSKDHVCWDIIYRTAEAAKKPLTAELRFSVTPFQSIPMISSSSYKNLTVREVVRKRRSAVDMDGVHVMERETFYQILLHCLPSVARDGEKLGKPPLAFPFRVLPWNAEIHFVLFVHRVKDLSKGVYFLVRNEDHLERLRRATRSDFEWEKPDGCPDDLPLYRLAKGDCQKIAKQLSCHQDIAGDGCFSLGMIARFEPTLSEKNAWMYPRLFWETGVLGQVLYLEAHAVGISATGIGCYFDDGVHEVLGLKGAEFQSLYHFTVGGPVVDKRIMSLPAYPGPNIDA